MLLTLSDTHLIMTVYVELPLSKPAGLLTRYSASLSSGERTGMTNLFGYMIYARREILSIQNGLSP